MEKLYQFVEFLKCVLETAFPEIHDKISDIDENMINVFSANIQTLFIYDAPEHIGAHIYDIFLLDGEQIIFTLLIKMIELHEETILSIDEDNFDEERDLLTYLRCIMPLECLTTVPLTELLD